MASAEQHPRRRQQQRQRKQQSVLGRYSVTKTSTNRFEQSLPRKGSSRRLRATQRQRQRFELQSRLNWLRRLFGNTSSSPSEKQNDGSPSAMPQRGRIQPAEVVKLEPPSEKPPKRRPRNTKVKPISGVHRRRNSVISFPQPLAPKRRSSSIGSSRTNKSTSNKSTVKPNSKTPREAKPKPKLRRFAPLIYGTRLLILGIGLGVVMGTLLSVGNPGFSDRNNADRTNQSSQVKKAVAEESSTNSPISPQRASVISPSGEEISSLKTAIAATVEKYPRLTPGVFILDIDTDAYLDLNGTDTIASASTIKIPILVAFFQDVDAGKIRLDELLTMKPKFIAQGSGNMQHKFPGSKYTALETATKMITISDNTATNMLIERLGGMDALNQRFQNWGLTATALGNQLPDIEGTNTTSAKDLAAILALAQNGDLLSNESRTRLLTILRRTERNHLLSRGMEQGTIAHKTGFIGSMLADAGLIELPNGKRYIAAVMVKRPRNDPSAEKLIRQISRIAYQHFSKPTPSTPVSSPDNSIISPSEPIEPLGNSPSAVAGRQSLGGSRDKGQRGRGAGE